MATGTIKTDDSGWVTINSNAKYRLRKGIMYVMVYLYNTGSWVKEGTVPYKPINTQMMLANIDYQYSIYNRIQVTNAGEVYSLGNYNANAWGMIVYPI